MSDMKPGDRIRNVVVDGITYREVIPARRSSPRVVFKMLPRPYVPADAVNTRKVLVDGMKVGVLDGIEPSPYNPERPTAYRFRPLSGTGLRPAVYDRLATARDALTPTTEQPET